MTLQRAGGAAAFDAGAAAYAATMAPALRPVAREVVRRAAVRPGESVLDIGTGTGTAAGLATGDGRHVVGVDAARGMLEIARREVPDVEFVEADFTDLPMATGRSTSSSRHMRSCSQMTASPTLREWRRVVAPGGRISLSVPGPNDVVPATVLHSVFDRYGIIWRTNDYPTMAELADWATQAGWSDVETAADPTIGIQLADDDLFRAWLSVGPRGRATGDWTSQRRDEFARDLMAATPRSPDGGYWLPFGALYLTARTPR